jgi:hypothetical protein
LVDERDHFASVLSTRHVLDDRAIAKDQPVEERAQQLPPGVRVALLPDVANPLLLYRSPHWQRTVQLVAQLVETLCLA